MNCCPEQFNMSGVLALPRFCFWLPANKRKQPPALRQKEKNESSNTADVYCCRPQQKT